MAMVRADWERIIELTKAGMSRVAVARELKITSRTVANVLRPLGLLSAERVKLGKDSKRKAAKALLAPTKPITKPSVKASKYS